MIEPGRVSSRAGSSLTASSTRWRTSCSPRSLATTSARLRRGRPKRSERQPPMPCRCCAPSCAGTVSSLPTTLWAARPQVVTASCRRGAGRPGAHPSGTAWCLVESSCQRAIARGRRLLPLPAADRLSRRRDPRPQAARYPPIKVGDVDQRRQDRAAGHEEPERPQAAALAAGSRDRGAQQRGRKADEPLFPIVDARKTLAWINAKAGTTVQGHGLRATFASIAEELVSWRCSSG